MNFPRKYFVGNPQQEIIPQQIQTQQIIQKQKKNSQQKIAQQVQQQYQNDSRKKPQQNLLLQIEQQQQYQDDFQSQEQYNKKIIPKKKTKKKSKKKTLEKRTKELNIMARNLYGQREEQPINWIELYKMVAKNTPTQIPNYTKQTQSSRIRTELRPSLKPQETKPWMPP
jgi:hypothetical protein